MRNSRTKPRRHAELALKPPFKLPQSRATISANVARQPHTHDDVARSISCRATRSVSLSRIFSAVDETRVCLVFSVGAFIIRTFRFGISRPTWARKTLTRPATCAIASFCISSHLYPNIVTVHNDWRTLYEKGGFVFWPAQDVVENIICAVTEDALSQRMSSVEASRVPWNFSQ